MRRPGVLDWLGATVIWSFVSIASGVILSEGMGAPEELGVMLCFGMFFSGVVGARLWWLRLPEDDRRRTGLTTGEAQLTRLEEVEVRLAEVEALHDRVAELEDRLDFSERLLANANPRALEGRRDA
jgi:hypothetical protein